MAEWTNEDVRRKASRYRVDRSLWPVMAEHFDRWLAAHDAEVRAQAVKDAADEANLAWLAYRPHGWGSNAEDQEALKAFVWALKWLRARAERGEA